MITDAQKGTTTIQKSIDEADSKMEIINNAEYAFNNRFTPLMQRMLEITNNKWDGETSSSKFLSRCIANMEDNRTKQLFILLLPIQWHYETTSSQKQAEVREKRKNINIVKPFLTANELELVNLWEKEN